MEQSVVARGTDAGAFAQVQAGYLDVDGSNNFEYKHSLSASIPDWLAESHKCHGQSMLYHIRPPCCLSITSLFSLWVSGNLIANLICVRCLLQLRSAPTHGSCPCGLALPDLEVYRHYALSTALWTTIPSALFVWLAWVSYIYPFSCLSFANMFQQFRDSHSGDSSGPSSQRSAEYQFVHGMNNMVLSFDISFPFGAERLSIADDDAIKQMTVRNPYNYPKPVRAKLWMVRILGEGVLLAEGQTHVHQRKALAPGFSINSIRSLAPVFWAKVVCTLHGSGALRSKTEGAKVKDTSRSWSGSTALRLILLVQAGLGTDIDSLNHPETVPIREAYRLVFAFDISSRVLHGLAAFMPITKYLPAKMNRDMLASPQHHL